METPPLDPGTETIESLRQRVAEFERVARMLETQVKVLERERQKLAAVVRHGDVGFVLVGADLRVTWSNEFFSQHLREQNRPASFAGLPCHHALCRKNVQCDECPAVAALESGCTAHSEITLEIDGATRTLYATAIPITSAEGDTDQVMTMVQDVSGLEVLRASERMLRESEGRLRLLVEQMPAVMWSTDMELRFTSISGSALGQLGIVPKKLVGRGLYEHFRAHDPSGAAMSAHLSAVAGRSASCEMTWNGREFETYVEPLMSPDRTIIGCVALGLDVTDRRAAEDARRLSEARKNAILEAALDAIVIMDHQACIVEFNPAAEKMFQYSRADVLGRPLAEVIIPPRLRPAHVDGFKRFLTTGHGPVLGRRIESIGMRKDGSEIPVELAISRIPLDGPPSFTGHIRDLTDRKAAEAELRERDELLRQTQRMEAIGTLAGGVAHDFNNILTAILGYAGLLKRLDTRIEGVQRAADVVEKAATRGAVLTQQLLGFARKGKNESVPVELPSIVEEVTVLLQRTIDKKIAVHRTTDSGRLLVMGDPGQLQQVVLNLAINARDAMPDGGRLDIGLSVVDLDEDECRRRPGANPGRYVRLEVQDTGHGIPEEVRGRIFEPFFTTKDVGKGTGMGLAMVYGIVQNHGGVVAVRSEVKVGTTFEILLPQAPESAAADAARRSDAVVPGTGRVLVVDDEASVREVAADILESLGYQVTTAKDGASAIETYREAAQPFDAVLLDFAMPGMDGRECFRALRKIDPAAKVLLCTGYGFDVAGQALLDEGMVGVVAKPYEIARLSDAIAAAIRSGATLP